ncbi:MAG TPA: hypothetical protein PLN19_07565 [Methanothrix sp.]|jgi:hypothetical protein|nr:hypothetical protein [Methanothrix sp.]HOV81681.1 hypothetical protein [Methanothrix sp.]HPC89185.1 hypothetical protein [Methanothrix sp.]HQE88112.1 hypothetical protein [Methanothrix sp.]HQI67778.1 hypothetical protein [Methanothrix sp.]
MMKKAKLSLIILGLIAILTSAAPALSDYQQGVLDGLKRGWFMAQRYDQALQGDANAYNQAVPDYNAWIRSVFGENQSLLLQPFTMGAGAADYSVSRTIKPVHSIDASWNQSGSLLEQPDASGLIKGVPAEAYYSIGPALIGF